MSDTKFQASAPRGSEEEDFLIILFISMVRTQDPLQRGHFGSWNHYLNKFGKRLLAKAKFQAPEPSSSEEDFKHISSSNTRPPAAGPFWTLASPTEQTW